MRRWAPSTRRKSHLAHTRVRPSVAPSVLSMAPEERARDLRALLQEAGPYYRSFALYLSSRIDLLPAEYCREFATVPDSAEILLEQQVGRILGQELDPRQMS